MILGQAQSTGRCAAVLVAAFILLPPAWAQTLFQDLDSDGKMGRNLLVQCSTL